MYTGICYCSQTVVIILSTGLSPQVLLNNQGIDNYIYLLKIMYCNDYNYFLQYMYDQMSKDINCPINCMSSHTKTKTWHI